MTTLALPFGGKTHSERASDAPPGLRPYQVEAVAAVRKELLENRGTLITLPTGTGKTQVASELIRTAQGRCLFIAHRDELIMQAAKRIEQFTGVWPDIEQAHSSANPLGGNHVVASIQTLSRASRLERFDPGEFALIIVDEAHHGIAPTYRRVLDYFTGAKVVGLTATPDRLDGEALGQIVESVAFNYTMQQAIDDGWLAPMVTKTVRVDGLDLSKLKTIAGDFEQGELDAIMAREENLHKVAKPAVEIGGNRKAIVFTTSVDNAKRLAEILNRYAGDGAAVSVDGKTPTDERRALLRRFSAGEHRYLVNVGIATEGYDEPTVAAIIMGRPTKSRALYVQMVGRGLRGGRNFPIPGKEDCLVIDFVGNTGKHELVTTVDILGQYESAEVVTRAKKIAEASNEPIEVGELVKKAKTQIADEETRAQEKRRKVQVDVSYSTDTVDPFGALGVKRDYLFEKYGFSKASDKQQQALERWLKKHAKDIDVSRLSRHEASRLLAELAKRADNGLSSYPQMKLLKKFGWDASAWSFAQAKRIIDLIASRGWNSPAAHVVNQYLHQEETEAGARG